MQSRLNKPLCRSLLSLLVIYGLLLLWIPSSPSAVASSERKETLTKLRSFSVPVAQQNAIPRRSGELLIRFRSGLSEHDKEVVIASQGARRTKVLRGESTIEKLELSAGQNPETAAQQLRLNPAIEFAEPNFLINHDELRGGTGVLPEPTGQARPLFDLKVLNPERSFSNPDMKVMPQSQGIQPNDQRFGEQWALSNTGQNGGQFGSDIGVTGAWQTTTGSQSTVIAVIDSGIDFTHPDLANNKWRNPAPGFEGDLNGWDYITESGTVVDECPKRLTATVLR